jgi:hypothetical protein
MALDASNANASINPNQAQPQGGLSSALGGTSTDGGPIAPQLDPGYGMFAISTQNPITPNISNFNQAYYQSPQYQSYLNLANQPMAMTDDFSPLPFGGMGSGTIAGLQQQSYNDFLNNLNMAQPPTSNPLTPTGTPTMAGLIAGTPSQIGNTLYPPTPSTSSPTGFVDSQGTPVTQAGYAYNPNAPQVDPGFMMTPNPPVQGITPETPMIQGPNGYVDSQGTPDPNPTVPVNYSNSPSSGGLSSLLNTGAVNQTQGTPTMTTNPLSQISVTPTTNSPAVPDIGATAGSPQGGNLTQGSALPNITTTQQQATAAPQFYTDYLNQLAQQGGQAAQNAQYVGASPLQQQAFNQVGQNVGNYQPTLNSAINLAQGVGQSNIVDALGNLNQQNIATNLSPQTTAGIVGAGQFGSTRGAQALGQTINAADIATQAQQAQAMQQDYANRLAAAGQLGNLAGQQQSLGLGDVNALATLGGQQQTIAQNQQLFPMQQLTNESALLRGYTMPTSTSSSYTGPIPGAYAASPLQQIAGLGALAAGVSNTPLGSAIGTGLSGLGTSLSAMLGLNNTGTGGIPASQSTGEGTSTQPLSMPVDTTGAPGSTAVDSSGNAIGTYDSSGAYTPYIQN